MRKAELVLLLISLAHEGFGVEIFPVSSQPVRAFQGSHALFQWTIDKQLISRPDFQGLVFGVWKNGYVASYILSVTKDGGIIPNPAVRHELPSLADRVHWKGDLRKSIAAFRISHIKAEDEMDYGLRLQFRAFLRRSLSVYLSLRVKAGRGSAITATLSPPLSVPPGGNTSFQCEFQLRDSDQHVYDGITVGTWKRGGIYLTLLTLTKSKTVIINPKLDQEVPRYLGRVYARTWSDKTSNTSMLSIKIKDVRESDAEAYGCRMFFGPFQGSLGASVSLNVRDASPQYMSQIAQISVKVRVGEYVRHPCQVLSEVKQREGTFKAMYWSYCHSENCTGKDVEWSWIAGMNSEEITQVNDTGPYANRTRLFPNGSLEIVNVKASDETVYKCTVERNLTSPKRDFFMLNVDSRVPPKITTPRPSEVTVHEGNVLYLKCDAKGNPTPVLVWRKDGRLIENQTVHTQPLIRENVSKADEGVYVCEASNSAGSDSYMVTVVVRSIIPVEEPKATSSKDKLGAGVIVGIVAAVVVFIALSGIGYWCYQRKQRREIEDPADPNRNTNLHIEMESLAPEDPVS